MPAAGSSKLSADVAKVFAPNPIPYAGPTMQAVLSFSDYQRNAARTMNASLAPDELLIDAAAGLAEEAGEALGIVRKHLYRGRPLDDARLTEELGDALWCIAAVATARGLSLETIAAANIEKLRQRYPADR